MALDTFHLICGGPRLTEAASELEMDLLKTALPLRIKAASPHARKQMVAGLRRWLQRLKRSSYASAKDRRELARLNAAAGSDHGAPAGPLTGATDAAQVASEKRDYARRVADWLSWLLQLLCAQLYHGSPTARSLVALDFYEVALDEWAPLSGGSGGSGGSGSSGSGGGSGSGGSGSASASDPADDPYASLSCAPGLFDPASLFSARFAARLVRLLLQNYDV